MLTFFPPLNVLCMCVNIWDAFKTILFSASLINLNYLVIPKYKESSVFLSVFVYFLAGKKNKRMSERTVSMNITAVYCLYVFQMKMLL